MANDTDADGEEGATDTEPTAAGAADDQESDPIAALESDSESAATDQPTEREREFATMQRRLNEREMGLDQRSEELDRREQKVDARETELDELEADLDEREYRLDEREAALDERETELDQREAELDEYDRQLSERADTLDEHEETLNTYLQGQMADLEESVTETMHDALDRHQARSAGRFGPTGTVLVGLAGVALAVAGIGLGALAVTGSPVVGAGGQTTNLVIAAVVTIVGLALNLGTVAGRL